MTEKMTIEEIFPVENGLLSTIGEKFTLEFADSYRLSTMDEEYIYVHSGMKLITRVVEKFYKEGILDVSKLSEIIGNRYVRKWNSLWKGLTVEYDILTNYDMTEKENTNRDMDDTITSKETGTEKRTSEDNENKTNSLNLTSNENKTQTDKTKFTDTGTESRVVMNDGNDTETTTNSDTINENVDETKSLFGFNSSSASNSDETNRTTSSEVSGNSKSTKNTSSNYDENYTKNNTSQKDGTITDTGERTSEENLKYDATISRTENGENSKTGNSNKKTIDNIVRTLTRKGNIGVTSSAQLQEQYIKIVESWYDFCKVVYDDMDSILTLYII